MTDDTETGADRRVTSFLRHAGRAAGRRVGEIRRAYREGRAAGADFDAVDPATFDLPADDGRARVVCRRYAEKRAVSVDADGRPACYDPEHPDCRGCAEDVRAGLVETW